MQVEPNTNCQRLGVAAGTEGTFPVMGEVKVEAARREVALVTVSTRDAIRRWKMSRSARTQSCG